MPYGKPSLLQFLRHSRWREAACTSRPAPRIPMRGWSERVTLVMCSTTNSPSPGRVSRVSARPRNPSDLSSSITARRRHPRVLQRFEAPIRSDHFETSQTRSVIASLNRAWRTAETEFLCLLHNDTELSSRSGSLDCSEASPSQGLA